MSLQVCVFSYLNMSNSPGSHSFIAPYEIGTFIRDRSQEP